MTGEKYGAQATEEKMEETKGMDYNDTYEREIDLKELMFAVLGRWRMILAFAVVFAVLLGGYKGASAYRNINNTKANEEAQESYDRELELYNKSLEACKREIANLSRDIDSQQEYVENSILMNMSPYDVWEAKADLFVTADEGAGSRDNDFTTTIMRAYQSALTSGELLSEIAQNMGVDDRYIHELVTVTMGRDSYYRDDDLFSVESKGSGFTIRNRQDDRFIAQDNLLTVQVRHEDEEKARELLTGVLEGVNRFYDQIRSGVGPHTISEINNSVGSRVDLALADQQNDERIRLDRLKESLQRRKDEMEKLKQPEGIASPISSAVKYGVIGGVLGAFVIVFFACIGFVMSDKVYSAKELKYRFKVKVLGILCRDKTRNAGKIDAWLNRLEGRACDVDEGIEYGLISANICNYMEGAKSLLVIGSAQEEKIGQVASELAGRLSGVTVVSGGNVLHNAQGLRKLPECDGVVLVEQCGKSLYSEVQLEIEKASDLHKPVVGCIVFE